MLGKTARKARYGQEESEGGVNKRDQERNGGTSEEISKDGDISTFSLNTPWRLYNKRRPGTVKGESQDLSAPEVITRCTSCRGTGYVVKEHVPCREEDDESDAGIKTWV